MSKRIKITIADPSEIIRRGLTAILKDATPSEIEISEVSDMGQLMNALNYQRPDILMVNVSVLGVFSPHKIRKDCGNADIKLVGLQTSMTDPSITRHYDETISVYENPEQIKDKINRLSGGTRTEKKQESLSQREKEVVACVVKGMTNKQIADRLCLSTHTVITHRRNISAKLDIHSSAGLTIYAIVNKLVELDDISQAE
jgi:Response regulator containing a CheY-like receiver domain and an HTH DNA-binding domain